MVKVHYYGNKEVKVDCEYVVDYSTIGGRHYDKKFAFEKKVLLDENFNALSKRYLAIQRCSKSLECE